MQAGGKPEMGWNWERLMAVESWGRRTRVFRKARSEVRAAGRRVRIVEGWEVGDEAVERWDVEGRPECRPLQWRFSSERNSRCGRCYMHLPKFANRIVVR